jgi:hypothetical protein
MTLERFLRARGFDVAVAAALFIEHRCATLRNELQAVGIQAAAATRPKEAGHLPYCCISLIGSDSMFP